MFTQGIFPAFEQAWEAETGEEIELEGLFHNLIEDFWKTEIEPALDLDPADSLLVR